MIAALVLVLLSLGIALLSFEIGRETAKIERAHAETITRLLHPSAAGANVVDQDPGESVRLVRDDDPPFDWQEGDDVDA